MKKKMVGMLIAFIIVVGLTNQVVLINGGDITTLGEGGIGKL